MGLLRHPESGRALELAATTLVGRHPPCLLVLDDPRVSGVHAQLRWRGAGWWVRDMGSRNGTAVDGRRLPPGEDVALRRGSVVVFGDAALRWELAHDAPPRICARPLDGGEPVPLVGGSLALPDARAADLLVFLGGSGVWVCADADAERTVTDGAVLTAGGRSYRLELGAPDPTAPTGPTPETPLALHFAVSSDEEHVDLVIAHGERRVQVKASVHHYLLLLLARQRQADEESAERAPHDRGWVDRDVLCRMLRVEPSKLNVDVFRLRRLLAATGLPGAAALVERRPTTHQLRVGTAHLFIR